MWVGLGCKGWGNCVWFHERWWGPAEQACSRSQAICVSSHGSKVGGMTHQSSCLGKVHAREGREGANNWFEQAGARFTVARQGG